MELVYTRISRSMFSCIRKKKNFGWYICTNQVDDSTGSLVSASYLS